MKNKIKNLTVALKFDSILRSFNRTPRVLFYHGVDNRVNPAVEAEIFDINEFENQIEYLVKHYEIISIEDFEQRFINSSFTNREVVLTFDDGYANNLYIVDPILSKYKLPYTVFISTEHITTGQF
ncbi:MAG: polysaccharide deacetylase family protein, partial [Clostridia bacterium]|nr:polysaccharide deacetylase family protein [Clostridia bacterium]